MFELPKDVKVIKAGGFYRLLLKTYGKDAMACIDRKIRYVGKYPSQRCLAEEYYHLCQMRELSLMYIPIWFYYNRIYGYDKNPLEVAAKNWAKEQCGITT